MNGMAQHGELYGNKIYGNDELKIQDETPVQAIAFSGSGKRTVVSWDNGTIHTYNYVNSEWIQEVGGITPFVNDSLGVITLAISENGERLIVGNSGRLQPRLRNGKVKVYELRNHNWVQLGDDFITDGVDNYSLGIPVSINSSGDVIAFSNPESDYFSESSGEVFTYYWNSNTWESMGAPIRGIGDQEQMGNRIALSGRGDHLAITKRIDYQGEIRQFRYYNQKWDSLEVNIRGPYGDFFGHGLAISNSGHRLAIGNPYSTPIPRPQYEAAGMIFIFSFDHAVNTIDQNFLYSIYPNPTRGIVRIDIGSEVDYTVTNLLGSVQKASRTQNGEINITDLPNGVYILRLRDGQRQFSTKVVKARF